MGRCAVLLLRAGTPGGAAFPAPQSLCCLWHPALLWDPHRTDCMSSTVATTGVSPPAAVRTGKCRPGRRLLWWQLGQSILAPFHSQLHSRITDNIHAGEETIISEVREEMQLTASVSVSFSQSFILFSQIDVTIKVIENINIWIMSLLFLYYYS